MEVNEIAIINYFLLFTGKTDKLDYVEDVVCNQNDIAENEMKLLPLGDDGGKILLIKQKGELHAIGTKCTHYGALLNTGALGEGRVRCPWHGACFNIITGDIEDYPGLDSLPCYKVKINKCNNLSTLNLITHISLKDTHSIFHHLQSILHKKLYPVRRLA